MNFRLSSEWSTTISSLAAVISVFAALYAARQARAAKRQADAAHGDVAPTIYVELHEEERQFWGFRLEVRNFNRRPLKIKRIRIRPPRGLILWEGQNTDPDRIRAINEAARNRGEVLFEIEQTLDGVSPNASLPTAHHRDFHVGMATGTSEERRTVQINLAIEWEYTSGKPSPKVEQMTVNLPIGKDQTSEAR